MSKWTGQPASAGCLVIACLVALLATPASAQQLPFAHLSISDGLEDTVIFSMQQDRHGFLWIATRTGLNRFDGATFWTYTQAEGLPHNLARDIQLTQDGTLWVATERGVAWFDGNRFVTPGPEFGWPGKTSARALDQGQDGSLWAATYGAGVIQIQPGNNARVVARYGKEQGMPTDRVRALLVGSDGHVWLGTSDHAVLRIREGQVEQPTWTLDSTEVRTLYEHVDGALWAGTREGVGRLVNGRFESALSDSDLARQTINDITHDRNGRIWFGSREGGAYAVDTSLRVEHLTTRDGLPDNSVNEILQDTEGNLWFGTYGGGVARLSTSEVLNWKAQPAFPSPNVYAIADDQRGCIWFGTNGSGVTRLCDSELTHFTKRNGLPHNKVLSAMIDHQGDPWFGTLEGISHFNGGQFENYGEDDGLGGMVSYHMLRSREGGFWVGTIDGLSRYRDGRFEHFDESDGLPDNRVNRIYERPDGALWLATANGLARFEQGRFERWSTTDGLPSNFINDLYEDDRGLWIATNNGLSLYREGQFRNWTRDDGLPHNNCTVILPGRTGEIWIGSSRGVAIFDGNVFTVVTSREGLVFDLINRGAGYRDPEGNLWFGTGEGVSRFAADFRPGDTTPPPIQLLSVSDSAGQLPLDQTARIALRDESLTFAYSAISFQRAPDVVYRYRMARTAESPWRETRLRELQITSLAPGDYRFEVTARIGKGGWNPQPASFSFTVVPPFWFTPWFLALVVAGVIGTLLYRNHLSRRHALELEATVAERTRELQELNEGLEWLANHDNLTHLANRNQVAQRLARLYADDPDLGIGVIIIDLDHFKVINDRYGHAVGDQVLEAFAQLLHGNVRTDQIAARWGGEEFLVVCPGIEAGRLQAVAEHLLTQCREMKVDREHGSPVALRCSMGFAMTPPGSGESGWEKALQLADMALLESKRNGRDRATGYWWSASGEPVDLDQVLGDSAAAVERGILERRETTG